MIYLALGNTTTQRGKIPATVVVVSLNIESSISLHFYSPGTTNWLRLSEKLGFFKLNLINLIGPKLTLALALALL